VTKTPAKYRALISSDWNECLAPCGPFDFISFTYPSLDPSIKKTFKAYTSNHIPLSEAIRRIAALLPQTITEDQMDAYLDDCFLTYRGVTELIQWCSKQNILFMINTTGMQGYFQRVFKKGLLPEVPVASAHPMIKFEEKGRTFCRYQDLFETRDKPLNTQKIMGKYDIGAVKTIVIGDSGGDGPHFVWAAENGAMRIGSMTKVSLEAFCRRSRVSIDRRFGLSYAPGEQRNPEAEMAFDFQDLVPDLADRLL